MGTNRSSVCLALGELRRTRTGANAFARSPYSSKRLELAASSADRSWAPMPGWGPTDLPCAWRSGSSAELVLEPTHLPDLHTRRNGLSLQRLLQIGLGRQCLNGDQQFFRVHGARGAPQNSYWSQRICPISILVETA